MIRKLLHILSPVAAAWLAALAIATVFCGIADLDEARLVAQSRPEIARVLVVDRMQIVGEAPRQWRVVGHFHDESATRARTLVLDDEDALALTRDGGRLSVVETWDADEPLVSRRWYEAQHMVLLGQGIALPEHLLLGLALAMVSFALLLRVSRASPPAHQPLVQSEQARARLDTRHAALVSRLERRAERDLPTYRRRVLAVALLGYGFVLAVCALFAATLLGGVPAVLEERRDAPMLEIVLSALAVGGALLAALRVRVPLPEGERVTRAEAPLLFDRLDSLRLRLGGPRLDEVVITEEFNAAIVQRPRLGLLGWPRNHLLIGLPLMQALTPEQFEAVLAHEYGHVAQSDGRFAAAINRMRHSWLRLCGETGGAGPWRGFLFQRFFDWYAPWFNAHSFVLARQSELAADVVAARVTSPRVMVDALATVAVRGRQLETAFWPNLYDGARYQASPPPVYRALGIALKQGLAPDAGEAHLRAALSRRTGLGDTHPTLVRRAKALGQEVRVPPAPVVTAAEELLGPAFDSLLARCDARWTARCGAAWRDTFAEAERERALLAELETRAGAGGLSLEERWCRAKLTETARDEAAAELLYREIVAEAPDHAPSHFALARLMLERGEASEALVHLEQAMAADDEAEIPGCELAAHHLERLGRALEASVYRLRMVAARREREEALAARTCIRLDDEVAPAQLTAGDLERVRGVLAEEPAVSQAWLARKVLSRDDGRQSLILVIAPAPPSREGMQDRIAHALAALDLPGEFWIVPENLANAPLCERIQALPGSVVFTHSGARARS